jgi:hypothetical protein
MRTAVVTPLPDGYFSVDYQGHRARFHEVEEAVEEARHALRMAGGGIIRLLAADGSLRDQIKVSVTPKQAASPESPVSPDRYAGGTTPADRPPQGAAGNAAPYVAAAPEQHPSASKPESLQLPDVPQSFEAVLRKGADKAIEAGLKGWWSRRSPYQKGAIGLISFGLAIGPLGQGVLAAFGALFNDKIPNSTQVEALVWLLWITAPLAAFVVTCVWLARRRTNPVGILLVAGAASVLTAWVVFASGTPKELAGVYCYADVQGTQVIYEQQCRDFNSWGFIAENAPRIGHSDSANIGVSAFVFTIDARGQLMAFAAFLASVGVGVLLPKDV